MVMPACGTFQYFGVIAAKPEEDPSPWPMRLRAPIERKGDPLHDDRLVGHAPSLQITDGGPAPSPANQFIGRSRLTLTAHEQRNARVSAASFFVDRELTRCFNRGDILHLARTHSGGLGLSLLRDGRLVLAVGAVSAVPLGDKVRVTGAGGLAHDLQSLYQERDPTFELVEYPLEISVDGQTRIAFGRRTLLGDHNVWVLHGPLAGMPGKNESVVVASRGSCSLTPIQRSAEWMEGELEMVGW
jgi:hypothetical protein